jgi:DNA-binding CsgD family transcriptional regulator/tetratricopeptide (TPR) repeat protein
MICQDPFGRIASSSSVKCLHTSVATEPRKLIDGIMRDAREHLTRGQDIKARTLELASLLGTEFSLTLLQTAAGSRAGVEALFDEGRLTKGKDASTARFGSNAEARKVAAKIPWSRRRNHCVALGEAARKLRWPAEAIAPFFESAQQPEMARGWWVKAAQKACGEGAYRRALEHLDRALGIWPWTESPDERVAVLRELARCAANGGRLDPARRAWEELADYGADTGQAALEVEALRHLAGLASDPARVSDFLKRAAEVAERGLPDGEAVRQLLVYADHLASRVRVAMASGVLERAVRKAERAGEPALLSEVRGWQGLIAAMSGRHERARTLVEESLRLAVEHDLTEQAALAYRRRANIQDYRGGYAEEKKAHTAAIDFCRKSKVGGEIVCLGCLSYACFRTGDWAEAIRSAQAVARGEKEAPTVRAIASCVLGLIHAFRGERGPALRQLEAAGNRFRTDGFVGMEFFALWGLCYLRYSDGDPSGAMELLDQVRALWRETDDAHDVVPVLLFAGSIYADARSGDRLADCLDIVGRVLRRNPLGEARAALVALQAEQARLDGDEAGFRSGLAAAASRYGALALPVERLWVECRRAISGALGAEVPAQPEALTLATRLGARPMLAILQSTNSSPPDDLTPRQRETLRGLARGLTSKEIADRLGLSTRTVEMHVGRLLRRLNCRTRPEAIRSAIQRGWLKPD